MTDQTPRPWEENVSRLGDLHVVGGYEDLLRANQLDSLEKLFAVKNTGRFDKPGLPDWRERIRLEINNHGRSQTVYLKRYNQPPRPEQAQTKRSRNRANSLAGVEWNWIHRLAVDGIPCVRPVAFGEQIDRGQEVRSALLTAEVPGTSLEQLTAKQPTDTPVSVKPWLIPLADLIARFHEKGYIHRDLYFAHVFYNPAASPDDSLTLIDLQRVIRPQALRQRWIVKDLASLNYSARRHNIRGVDRLRWLKRYLHLAKMDSKARQLIYHIAGKTQRISRHDARRKARLVSSGDNG